MMTPGEREANSQVGISRGNCEDLYFGGDFKKELTT